MLGGLAGMIGIAVVPSIRSRRGDEESDAGKADPGVDDDLAGSPSRPTPGKRRATGPRKGIPAGSRRVTLAPGRSVVVLLAECPQGSGRHLQGPCRNSPTVMPMGEQSQSTTGRCSSCGKTVRPNGKSSPSLAEPRWMPLPRARMEFRSVGNGEDTRSRSTMRTGMKCSRSKSRERVSYSIRTSGRSGDRSTIDALELPRAALMTRLGVDWSTMKATL